MSSTPAVPPSDEVELSVREMRLEEVGIRIDYFHDADDDYLHQLGVDRSRLMPRAEWRAWYEADYARPIEERESYLLSWCVGEAVVGFSSVDHISYGDHAFMHLHIRDAGRRRSGFGTTFVRLSAEAYFAALRLKRLYCQPNAFNVAPNRTLQRAGFRYDQTVELRPSDMNFVQPITRWILDQS